ncbi:MAG TPA: hypothetical protein VF070_33045, partial [Streptosporangiaceae bacterium]
RHVLLAEIRLDQEGPPGSAVRPAAAATRTVTVSPALRDGVVFLDRYTDDDIHAHLAGEDEETARRFGWWPTTSTGYRPGRLRPVGT